MIIDEGSIIGLIVEDALDYAQRNGYELCVVQEGASPYVVSQEVGIKRVNVAVKDGRVSKIIGYTK